MFLNASTFNQDIGDWNISEVANMKYMLDSCGMITKNYDNTLIGWSSQNVQNNLELGAQNLVYCNGETARNVLINNRNWIISEDTLDCSSSAFVTLWKTNNPGTSNSTSITIPTQGSGYSYDVDWDNDGVYDELEISGSVTHDFGTAGIKTISIKGDFPRIYFNNSGDKEKLLEVVQWGSNEWINMNSAFYGCSNLYINATDEPDLSHVSDMSHMFRNAITFDEDISSWKVDSVSDMSSLFRGATLFSQDISSWEMSKVAKTASIFSGATSFNQNISTWDVGNVTDMSSMFLNAASFDKDLGNWDVSQVSNMTNMLNDCGMSRDNYDNTLIGWSLQTVHNGAILGAKNLIYCNGLSARSSLISNHNWTINGDQNDCPGPCMPMTNTWIGPNSGDWDVASSWSLTTIPDTCSDIVIPNGKTVTIPNSYQAICHSIEIATGGSLETGVNAQLECTME